MRASSDEVSTQKKSARDTALSNPAAIRPRGMQRTHTRDSQMDALMKHPETELGCLPT